MFATTLSTLAPRLRLKLDKPIIENFAFRLHYQLTVTFLLLCGLLVCARELLGDHIKCYVEKEFNEKYGGWLNNYCFFMSTFTFKELYDEDKVNNKVASHPGVGNEYGTDGLYTIIQHVFYQWVPFLLFFQAICFYLPHLIWKKQEGGRIKALVDGLQYAAISGDEDLTVKAMSIPSKKTLEQKLDSVKKDFLLRLRINRTWSVGLVAMEIANVLNVVFQIWLVNIFLGGTFIHLGLNVISFTNWDYAKVTPLSSIFPKVTKCKFYKYGPSGDIQNRDAICVMALNNMHEKIFTALWFWFLGLFIISVAAVIWRAASYFLCRYSKKFSMMMFRKASSARLSPEHVDRVVRDCHFEDWLFIYYLAKNMNAMAFEKLLKLIAQELEQQEIEDNMGFKTKIGFEPMMEAHNNMGYFEEKKQ